MRRTKKLESTYKVGSIRTARCQALPAQHEESGSHWNIDGFVVRDYVKTDGLDERVPHLVLIGDLFVHSTWEVAAASVEVMLSYDDLAFAERVQGDRNLAFAETQRTARDLEHILYDSAASVVRSLVALTDQSLEVPALTQEALVSLIEMDSSTEPLTKESAH